MALKQLQRCASAISMMIVSVCMTISAAFKRVPSQEAARPRSKAPVLQLEVPCSIQQVLSDIQQHEQIGQDTVPELINSNPLWHCLSTYSKDVYKLCQTQMVSAVLVVLHDTGIKLVLKAWSAERAANAASETEAELEAAQKFALHPLMATPVAACYDDAGNYCSATLYAGRSLESCITHPDWYTGVSEQDRLDFVRMLLPQWLQVFHIMQHTDAGFYHRDIKPENLTIDAATTLSAVIDYGSTSSATKENFRPAYSLGYFTPEMANPTDYFCTFRDINLQKYVTNPTTDVFLASYTALELAVGLRGLPWILQPELHDHQTGKGLFELLTEHANAAAAGYDALIARVSCRVARDFFVKTMCRDYAKRLTPEQALQHPWLADTAAVAQEAAAAVAPLYQQQTQLLVELFSEVPAVIIPQQQQQQKQSLLHSVQQQEVTEPQNDEEEYTDLNSDNIGAQQTADAPHLSDLSCAAITADMPGTSAQEAPYSGSSSSCSLMLHDEDTPSMDHLPTTGAEHVQSAGKPSILQRGKALVLKMSRPASSKSGRACPDEVSCVSGYTTNPKPKAVALQQPAAAEVVILSTPSTCVHTNNCCSDSDNSCLSSAISADVPFCSSGSTGSGSGYTSSRSSKGSQSSTEDTSAVDQWPPVATMTGSSTYSKKSHLLQKGKKLLAKIRSKHVSRGVISKEGTVMEAVTVQVWLDDDEPTRVKVPGWCGVRW